MPNLSETQTVPVAGRGLLDGVGTLATAVALDGGAVADEPVDELFRRAMTRLAAGVVIVTSRVDGRPWGVTATACCPVSMTPPLMLVSLTAGTVCASAIERSGSFGVNLLGVRALDAARFASQPGQPKFLDDYCEPTTATDGSASPIVERAAAHVDCSVYQVHQVADHLLFVGEVQAVRLNGLDRPLVYHSRRYHGVDAAR